MWDALAILRSALLRKQEYIVGGATSTERMMLKQHIVCDSVSPTGKAFVNASRKQNITLRCRAWGFAFSEGQHVVLITCYATTAALHHLLRPNVAMTLAV
jgi:hypothetical protein